MMRMTILCDCFGQGTGFGVTMVWLRRLGGPTTHRLRLVYA